MSSSVLASTTLPSWRERSPSSFSLKIHNFSQFQKSTVFSERNYQSCLFPSGGYKWRMIIYPGGNKKDEGSGFISMDIMLYPKGLARADGKWLSIFLCVTDSETLKEDEKIFTRGHFRLLDPRGSNHLIRDLNCWSKKLTLGLGYDQFTSLSELSKTYLDEEGSLNVEIEFDVVSDSKYPPLLST